ncbi:MAG: DUF4913 domain-containing protein [Proteobacteria bacterium]|nr:DUF4913 domain-containing protein [Pseudomonadota bacterium]
MSEAWGDELEESQADQAPALFYGSVVEFVREQLVPMYRRDMEGTQRSWCPEWWRHAEAIARLEALWRAWEHLRLDPTTGMSVWFRDHADHHMQILLDNDGPFRRCSIDKGHSDRLEALPLVEPLPGLFPADAHAEEGAEPSADERRSGTPPVPQHER